MKIRIRNDYDSKCICCGKESVLTTNINGIEYSLCGDCCNLYEHAMRLCRHTPLCGEFEFTGENL